MPEQKPEHQPTSPEQQPVVRETAQLIANTLKHLGNGRLQIIMGNADIIANDPKTSPANSQMLEEIINEAQALADIFNKIARIQRLEHDKTQNTPEPILDLNESAKQPNLP